MPDKRVQCIIFFASPAAHEMNLDNMPKEIYAFLPEFFINNHPDVMRVFKQNNIHVVRNECKLQILTEEDTADLEFLEIFLDDSSSVMLDPLLIVCDENDACLLFRLFSKTFIQLRRKSDEEVSVKPVTTEVKFQALSSFLRRSFTLKRPIYKQYRTNLSIHTIAAYSGQAVLVGLASKYGIDINQCNKDGWTYLHLAAYEGHPSTVRTLVENGATVDCRTEDQDRFTPLHLAKKHKKVARILLDNGADIHAKKNGGWSPLHSAASEKGSNAVVKLFIERGADVNARDNDGRTPLHNVWSSEIAETLLQHGADPNALSNADVTPILTEVIGGSGSVEFVRVLLRYGARADVKLLGDSLIQTVLDRKRHRLSRYLLERCFLDPVLLIDSIKGGTLFETYVDDVLGQHVVKIRALKLQRHNFTNLNLYEYLDEDLDEFTGDCEVEVARMKSQILCDSAVTVYDVLEKNDYQLAGLLRNDHIAQIAESDDWIEQYPIYGSILTCHFENGKLRKSLQEEGMKICSRLFSCADRPLPDEIKHKILMDLSNADLFNMKRAVAFFKS